MPAVTQVFQPDAGRRFGFELGNLGVRHDEQVPFGTHRDVERLVAGDRVVLDGVVDQRLQREGRKFPRQEPVVHVDVEKELVGIAYFKEVAVSFEEFQLLVERHQHALPVLDDVAERIRKLVDVGQGFLVVLLTHEHRQRVERIEEKVGVDLPDKHVVARREVFVLESFVLDDDSLPLRDQHVDTPVEHRRHHGERAFEQQHVVEHPPAHEIHLDAARMPIRDGRHAVEGRRRDTAPQAAAHEARHRIVAPYGGEDREHYERHDEVIEQLQKQFGHFRRSVVEFAVIELHAVVHAHLAQHRMRPLVAGRHDVGHDPVAGGDPQPAHPPRRDIDAVAVLVDQVAVAVGMHRKDALVAPFDRPFAGRTGLRVSVQVHEHQQYVGEVDHQADSHGNHQVEYQVGIFRLQFHGRKYLVRFRTAAGKRFLPPGIRASAGAARANRTAYAQPRVATAVVRQHRRGYSSSLYQEA